MSILYALKSGKNVKAAYFARQILRECTPHFLFKKYHSYLQEARKRPDFAQIMQRVSYYCQNPGADLGPDTVKVCDLNRKDCQSTYYYDLKEALSPFPKDTKINFLPGDITFVPQYPSLTKSRPIGSENQNSVILKMDRIRHFIRVNDTVPFCNKADIAVFRGKIPHKEKRERFFQMYFGNPICNLGDSSRHGKPEWHTEKLTIRQHLDYKFILALEGNDVASNLKWVMSSGSAAVMPKPQYETWFMEGTLNPGEHYIEIRRDFSDLPEILEYYASHPKETQEIINNANNYTHQFFDLHRERLISVLTVASYLGLL